MSKIEPQTEYGAHKQTPQDYGTEDASQNSARKPKKKLKPNTAYPHAKNKWYVTTWTRCTNINEDIIIYRN